MFTLRRTVLIGGAFTVAVLATIAATLQAQDVKITRSAFSRDDRQP